MSEPNEAPAPSSDQPGQEDDAAPLTHCPACSRKLLTQTSVICNWCGAKIEHPKYLERAAQSRQALDEGERKQIEAIVQEEARYGIFGRLKRRGKQGPGSRNPLG